MTQPPSGLIFREAGSFECTCIGDRSEDSIDLLNCIVVVLWWVISWWLRNVNSGDEYIQRSTDIV